MNRPSLRAWVVAEATLCGALVLAPLAAGAVAAQGVPGAMAQIRPPGRGSIAGKYLLETSSRPPVHTWVSEVEGGTATSDVVTEKVGPDHIAKKHIAGVKYEDISVNAHPEDVAGLLKDALVKADRINGKIVAADYNNRAVEETDFFNALPTGIALPALDGTSKEPCYVTLTLAPEFTKHVTITGGNSVVSKLDEPVGKCVRSTFQVTINGLEDGSKHVSRIEGIVMTRKPVDNPVGERRDYEKEPAHWSFSNVTLTLPESHAKEFVDWHDNFVIKGINDDAHEKTMTVKLLSPDMTHVLLELQASGVGIFKLTREKVEVGSENIRRVKAELYVESWKVVK